MTRRKWLWAAVVGIPLVAAGAMGAANLANNKSATQPSPLGEVTASEECSTSDCCKECPPDCPPEACPFCTK